MDQLTYVGEGWSRFPRNLGWIIFGATVRALLRSGFSQDPSPHFCLSSGDKPFNQWQPTLTPHTHQCTSVGGMCVWAGCSHCQRVPWPWSWQQRREAWTLMRGMHGLCPGLLYSRVIIVQPTLCLPSITEVPRISALSTLWQKYCGKGLHHSFPSQPIRSHQSQLAPAWTVFTICCSLSTLTKIKERKKYCSKCGLFWNLYQVDVNASKSRVS